MAKTKTKYDDLSREQLIATMHRNDRLGGITVARETYEWTPKASSRDPNPQTRQMQDIVIEGGVFTWKGLKITPEKWDLLLEMVEDISAVVAQERHHWEK